MAKISRVIESKLRFLKLTRAGKIRLSVFSDKVLYKAMDRLQRSSDEIPEEPFNTYFALCILESQRLQMPPTWEVMDEFPNYDPSSEVTLEDEEFDMKSCNKIMQEWEKKKSCSPRHSFLGAKPNKEYSTHHKTHGPAFTQGERYWKHGNWYKYPDQAIDNNSNPTKPDPNWRPKIAQDDPRRLNIDQVDELKKAIRSGKINKKGLAFLRDTYITHKPELIPTIDAYLNGYASPDDSQAPLF